MNVCKMNAKRKAFVVAARQTFGPDKSTITRPEIYAVLEDNSGMTFPQWVVGTDFRTDNRGLYHLPNESGRYLLGKDVPVETLVTPEAAVAAPVALATAVGVMENHEGYTPEKFNGYVPWGNFNMVKQIIKSNIFYPMFLTGLSGNGKTLMVQEACARLHREYVRANITIETDEDDLIGGFRLLNGETVWHDGPVVTAMKRGAILLLDEIDLASNKIMCLQPVLEGSSIYLKKIGKWVHPQEGFNIIATANTKGQGSEDGRFIGTNIMNESFLERFPVTVEQAYPTNKIEEKILTNELGKRDIVDMPFVKNLVKWADVIRKSFYEGACDEIISTRRLVHITNAFSIFDDKLKAISLCISRFDAETKETFLDLYTKVDEGVEIESLTNNDSDDDDEEEEEENTNF
jgi:cobaltochelatase CobS